MSGVNLFWIFYWWASPQFLSLAYRKDKLWTQPTRNSLDFWRAVVLSSDDWNELVGNARLLGLHVLPMINTNKKSTGKLKLKFLSLTEYAIISYYIYSHWITLFFSELFLPVLRSRRDINLCVR